MPGVTTTSSGRARSSGRGAALVTALFLLSLPAVTPRIYASDEVQYFSYLRSLWFDGDVSFENEYQHFYDAGIARSDGFHETFLERTTETGRRINFGTIGCAILWAPFYAAADVGVRAARATGADLRADGYTFPYVAAVAFGSATYGWLALLIALATVRRLSGDDTPLAARAPAATLLVWLGTPLLFYMYVAPPMSHAPSAFAVAAFLFTWIHVREGWAVGGCIVLGVLAALMAMVREQDAFFVAGPALDWMLHWWRTRGGTARAALLGRAAVGGLAGAAAYVPQAQAYLALNGYVGPSRLVARKMDWTAPYAIDVLVSPAHGFLVWTPLAAVAIAGLACLPRVAPRVPHVRVLTAALALVTLLQIYVAGSVQSWTVAGAFGQRRFVALTAVLIVGLAAALAWVGRPAIRRVAVVVLAVAAWWNVALIAQFGAGLMDRQRLEPRRLAYNAFVVVPRELPPLAWRYVLDRESFYEQTRRLREQAR